MCYALVVIDVQRGLFGTDPEPFEAHEVVARINSLIARARSTGIPVIFVRHETREGALVRGSDGWQLHQGLEVVQGDLMIGKTTPDSFLLTGLKQTLDSLGVGTLVICGYATEFCVDTTVRSAAGKGYDVILVSDAHTTHDKAHMLASTIREHHNRTLPNIKSFGVSIRAVAHSELPLRQGD